MFARHLNFKLKPNMIKDYAATFEREVMPILRKQAGFRDMLTLANPNGTDVYGISFWETKEQAAAYDRSAYPMVLESLNKFLESPPTLGVYSVVQSTMHKVSASDQAAA